MFPRLFRALVLAGVAMMLPVLAIGSSHSEAPGTAKDRLGDDTDFYAFVSPDQPNTTTLIGNWIPLLEPNAGPNFYAFDPEAVYWFNVDNVGDAVNHVRYEFRFQSSVRNGNTFLYNTGPVRSLSDPTLNVFQTYTVTRWDDGVPTVLGSNLPVAPANVGRASMPDYDALAREAVRTLSDGTKVFVGPRDDPFFVDLGAIFDLLTIRRLPGDRGRGKDGVAGYNVMTIALQIPNTRLTRDGQAPSAAKGNGILGMYVSTDRPTQRTLNADGSASVSGEYVQVSRLGMPLVNEVVIPLAKKDPFNASAPTSDGQFLSYVTNPELATLFNALYGIPVPPAPRNDLVTVFLTGVPGLNQPANVVACEKLRLNIAIAPAARPQRMGVLAGDLAGFPNGRRLADDVVDIAERVVAGVLVDGYKTGINARLGDGVDWNDRPFLPAFPYVAPPFSGFSSPHARLALPNPPGDRWGRGGDDDDDSMRPASDDVEAGALEQETSDTESGRTGIDFVSGNASSQPGLQYTLERAARVSLRIYDLQGREVRTLVEQDAAAGTFLTRWDGRRGDGAMAERGVYFARLVADGRAANTRKIVLP